MVSEYDQEITKSYNVYQPTAQQEAEYNNSHETSEDNRHKTSSSFFPIKMITKLEGQ